jgi:hypothetical protein
MLAGFFFACPEESILQDVVRFFDGGATGGGRFLGHARE